MKYLSLVILIMSLGHSAKACPPAKAACKGGLSSSCNYIEFSQYFHNWECVHDPQYVPRATERARNSPKLEVPPAPTAETPELDQHRQSCFDGEESCDTETNTNAAEYDLG